MLPKSKSKLAQMDETEIETVTDEPSAPSGLRKMFSIKSDRTGNEQPIGDFSATLTDVKAVEAKGVLKAVFTFTLEGEEQGTRVDVWRDPAFEAQLNETLLALGMDKTELQGEHDPDDWKSRFKGERVSISITKNAKGFYNQTIRPYSEDTEIDY